MECLGHDEIKNMKPISNAKSFGDFSASAALSANNPATA